ncbi:FAD-dependent monooxygenase [Sphaerisporangium album]|uniref:FAD-dependent monooxygenase n=1 Tax=Sphaerisporangium album TaxID=509200 RepID=A0A367F7G7_9ACTN|nr:FAD-dependent oxidoreductase [Sphaerisporangium album]RCG25869.1 FAD-dependent monooxygenase [Sphaerisporangium album]
MYDVIVVGGGVTGAASAALLARQGLRVMLCDRTGLPAPAVSTHFFGPSVLSFLHGLGVLDEVLATGAPPLRRWHLEVEGGYYGAPMLPRSPYHYNLCVRRETLSAILLRAASRHGAEIRERSPVRSLRRDGDQVTGVEGDGWSEKARIVVGADGRGSQVARRTGAATTFDAGVMRCTFHAYWEGVVPLPAPALELWHDGGHVLQVGPCDGGRWVVMLSAPIEQYDMLRSGASTGYEARLRAIPAMADRLRGARRVSPVYGSKTLRNFHRDPAGPGWRLAGDAYCHKDPLFGAGIADGCAAARALADTMPPDGDSREARESYAAALDDHVGQKVRTGLAGLRVDPPQPGQLAWIRGVLAHPGLALEMARRCSELFAGLPEDRRAFWQRVADGAADILDLPPAARVDPS